MYQTIADARHRIQEEAEDTRKILRVLADGDLDHAVAPGYRDLARLAWHLVESMIGLPAQMGISVQGPALGALGLFDAPAPRDIQVIATAYDRAVASLLDTLATWTDADLQREDTLYGQVWKRGYTLEALLVHQIHHRGQMTVLLRQAGLRVPEIYGPTREDWAAMGMAAPVV